MKRILMIVIFFTLSSLNGGLFECKVTKNECNKTISFETKDKKSATTEAFWIFRRGCPTITIKDINCSEVLSKKKELDSLNVAPIAPRITNELEAKPALSKRIKHRMPMLIRAIPTGAIRDSEFVGEEYSSIKESGFRDPLISPLSTFGVDVDSASYSIVRRYLMKNEIVPPKGAIRIEEMINYFDYDYKEPNSTEPFGVSVRFGKNIWNKSHKTLQIGLQAKKLDPAKLPPSNLVFLLDVSGSMNAPNKLPLLKKSFKLLLKNLRREDTISIVVYAGSSGVVLDGARGDKKRQIEEAINRLSASGSTAGGAGITLAYKIAKKHFIKGGNNRVILATDGDFNVGVVGESALVELIKKEKSSGVFLTILGFGMGNYKDARVEKLADEGDGNYAYIDNLLEAKKVLIKQMSGTLFTVAKDVKIQVEFNPAFVKKYRLVGYENRQLSSEDFKDDKKDAGEVGVGHQVTVLYEIVPQDKNSSLKSPLKYQKAKLTDSPEIATLKIRYKPVDKNSSKELSYPILSSAKSIKESDFIFAQAVASFGMVLKESPYRGDITLAEILKLARDSKGEDRDSYRAEFIQLVEKAELLKGVK